MPQAADCDHAVKTALTHAVCVCGGCALRPELQTEWGEWGLLVLVLLAQALLALLAHKTVTDKKSPKRAKQDSVSPLQLTEYKPTAVLGLRPS